MSEERREVKTFEVDMICDKCGKGFMRPAGNIVLATYPIQYPHECTNCGNRENYTKKYPYTEYEEYIENKKKKTYIPE